MLRLIPAQIKHLEICSKSVGIEILRTDLLSCLYMKCISGRRNAILQILEYIPHKIQSLKDNINFPNNLAQTFLRFVRMSNFQ